MLSQTVAWDIRYWVGYCSHEVSKNRSTETIWWEENQSLVELLTTHAHTESIICNEGHKQTPLHSKGWEQQTDFKDIFNLQYSQMSKQHASHFLSSDDFFNSVKLWTLTFSDSLFIHHQIYFCCSLLLVECVILLKVDRCQIIITHF